MKASAFMLRKSCLFFLALTLCIPSEAGVPVGFGAGLSPSPETKRAFDAYVAATDQKNSVDLKGSNFLWIDHQGKTDSAEAYAKLKRGDVLLRHVADSSGSPEIPGGLVHDWQGLVFVPAAKLDEVLHFLQDYDHNAAFFAPDVERAKIEEHNGDNFRIFLRFRRKKFVTVVLNTEHDVNYFRDSPTQAHSRSSAIRISEVDNPGEPGEKEKPPGQDNGFLWRMETWWRMEEKDGGVYVQNEAVSLTRDIPVGLGWAIEPFITTIPKESLEFTLSSVRRGVLTKSSAMNNSL